MKFSIMIFLDVCVKLFWKITKGQEKTHAGIELALAIVQNNLFIFQIHLIHLGEGRVHRGLIFNMKRTLGKIYCIGGSSRRGVDQNVIGFELFYRKVLQNRMLTSSFLEG